jgi:hypothetical protein
MTITPNSFAVMLWKGLAPKAAVANTPSSSGFKNQ